MSLALAVLLAFGIGLAALVAVVVGVAVGWITRRVADETAVRGLIALAVGAAALPGVVAWAVVDADRSSLASAVDLGFGPLSTAVAALVAVVVGGVAAGVVGTAAVAGVLAARPDLPGVDDPAAARRRYLRYLTALFAVAFAVVSAAGPLLRTGPLGVGAVLALAAPAFWIGGPFLSVLVAGGGTRPPTDAEAARVERLRDACDVDVRGVRVVEGGDRHVALNLLGAPRARVLFVSAAALDALDDGTLTALLVARREQAARYERPAAAAAVLLAAVPLVAGLYDGLPTLVGVGAAAAVVLAGFALTRRLRLRADDRAADRVGAAALATAFERACEVAGFDAGDDSAWNWLSSEPSLARRIERLRRRAARSE
ncbi:peptidase [Salinilacihabitans rarus]|uniref:peptidase n=1 Tax=Salinilacihabitans rarus TaxID=2961596 RepID=UPI0020C89923|nr:peptidase [Salinilacihabitans rarus]